MSINDDNLDVSSNVWRPDLPFNDLPRLPPEAELETKSVLKLCVGARSALAELKRAGELIPNQRMLINTLPLLEAQASSEIEDVVTTADELFRALPHTPDATPAVREALRYREALLEGFRTLTARPLGTVLAESVASRIKGVEMRVRTTSDTVLQNSITGEVVYTPPQGEPLLRDLLANWESFLHGATQIDPLVRMAVGHYQFEAIHPFADGNGRAGRVLNSLFLIEAGLLSLPILYLSRYFIADKSTYYAHLLQVTASGDWEPWIEYVLRGVEETTKWTLAKIEAIRELHNHTVDHLKRSVPKVYSRELVDVIFEQPYSRISNLVECGIAKRQTASKYLYELVDASVLETLQVGRDVLFVHPKLLRILTRDDNDFRPY
ncbi:MAG: Fic family protein [Trueperaceae bacterium]